jgi:hypothetical protein
MAAQPNQSTPEQPDAHAGVRNRAGRSAEALERTGVSCAAAIVPGAGGGNAAHQRAHFPLQAGPGQRARPRAVARRPHRKGGVARTQLGRDRTGWDIASEAVCRPPGVCHARKGRGLLVARGKRRTGFRYSPGGGWSGQRVVRRQLRHHRAQRGRAGLCAPTSITVRRGLQCRARGGAQGCTCAVERHPRRRPRAARTANPAASPVGTMASPDQQRHWLGRAMSGAMQFPTSRWCRTPPSRTATRATSAFRT